MADGQVGKRLKAARLRKALTVSMVSEETGISTGNLSDLERGRSLPSSGALARLSDIYDVTADWILKGGPAPWHEPFVPETTALQDPELREMIQYLQRIWESSDHEMRIWAKIQFRRAFSDFDEARKRRSTDSDRPGRED